MTNRFNEWTKETEAPMNAREWLNRDGDADKSRPTFKLDAYCETVLATLNNRGEIRMTSDMPNLLGLDQAKALAEWILEVCD